MTAGRSACLFARFINIIKITVYVLSGAQKTNYSHVSRRHERQAIKF